MTPRILLAAPASGAGKTTVTCALLQALVNRGARPMACKSGPDYIDPMFHSRIIGAKSQNLDLFFAKKETVRYLLEHSAQGCDITVLEGAMGYYDGIALTEEASAWALSRATDTPTVLIVDARGSGVSICATLQGFLHFRERSGICGVIFNRVSPMLYPRLKAAVEEKCGVRVYGYLPNIPECVIESRHLGLFTPETVAELREKMQLLAHYAEKNLDIDGLIHLAEDAPALNSTPPNLPSPVKDTPVVAVARDDAFCFYYEDNIRILQDLGGRIVYFSPLSDAHLPPCDALYLGGGYPELYAQRLSLNKSLRAEMLTAIRGGLPTLAECGGFLYLHEELEDDQGQFYPMAGVLPGRGYRTNRTNRFGYITLTSRNDNLFCKKGDTLPAHEFHYWDVEDSGADFHAQKPHSDRGWACVHASPTLYAGFPHLYFYGVPQAAKRFLQAAESYKRGKYGFRRTFREN